MALIEPEIGLDVDLYGYWDPILAIWFKPPATDGSIAFSSRPVPKDR